MAGIPDIVGVYQGLPIWIETKLPEGGAPTAIQQRRHREILGAGGHVLVARSVAEVVRWLASLP